MENSKQTFLPPPNFSKKANEPPKVRPHYLTPSGMTLLPRERQPPPMYGPRGATIPAKFLQLNQPNAYEPPTQQVERQFCVECEIQLEPQEDLRSHRLEHVPCPINDCQYRGHPEIMDKHIATLHASGIFDKIKKLNTPEEIAAWREERRKRYPSVANVALQQKAREQRQQRGERLEPNKNRFGRPEERRRIATPYTAPKSGEVSHREPQEQTDGHRKRTSNYKERAKAKRAAKRERAIAHMKPDESAAAEKSIAPVAIMFEGTSKMKNYNHVRPKKKEQGNALSSLVGMYGSDDEDESDSETESEDSPREIEMEETRALIKDNEHEKLSHDKVDAGEEPKDSPEVTSLCLAINCNKLNTPAQLAKIEMEASDKRVGEAGSKTGEPEERGVAATIEKDLAADSRVPQLQCSSIELDVSRPLETKVKANSSSDEAPEEAAIQRVSNVPTPAPKLNPLPATSQCSSGKPARKPSVKQRFKRKIGLDYSKAKLRKPHSMLERLLEPDIRHERNVLLQCVRYVVANNFFDAAEPKKELKSENPSVIL